MGNNITTKAVDSQSKVQKKQETVLQFENRTKYPMGFNMYLSESIGNALKGEASKDPLKVISNAIYNYSESPYYKIVKNTIKKAGEAAVWLLDKSLFLINKDITPYWIGDGFNTEQAIYM